ncbi:MAG: bifunctional riboflavin kinase/FAD synthetase [Cyanobacteria bacterium P01_C01_bin.73]
MWVTSSLNTAQGPTAIALGNFDGIHLGHRQVIAPVLRSQNLSLLQEWQPSGVSPVAEQSTSQIWGYSSWQLGQPQTATVAPDLSVTSYFATVLTFFPHPKEYFSGRPRSLLTPLEEKAFQLKQMGIDQLVLLPFNQALAQLSAEAFVEQILIDQLQAQHISVGVDFRFGYQRAGTAALLKEVCDRHQVPVTIVPLKCINGETRISSSSIRQALQTGDLARVKQRLGRPYSLTGTVVAGQRLGRTIGFPTANLKLPEEKFIPRRGVYSVWVYGIADSAMTPHLGVMNIGVRPTVDGNAETVEVHLLDWSGNLYGQRLTVMLTAFLRPEQQFNGLDQLKAQIRLDCDRARQWQPMVEPQSSGSSQ